MSARDILHKLVDELPEEDISTAKRVLQALSTVAAPHTPLEEAPLTMNPTTTISTAGCRKRGQMPRPAVSSLRMRSSGAGAFGEIAHHLDGAGFQGR